MARIILKKSSVASKVPLPTDLEVGELAINLADAKLYSKDSGDNILDLTPASSTADMTKAVYDTNNNGIVDAAEAVPWSGVTGKPTFATVATSGAYSDLSGKPTLSTVATSGSYTDLLNKPTLATVATSGAYSDLSGTPTLATVATSGSYTDLSNAPGLAAIATSGSYSDLIGAPTFKTIDGTSITGTGDYSVLPGIAAVTGDMIGVVDRNAATLSFNDATRTFTITPVSGSWTFYYNGVLKTVSSAKSIVISNTDGARWIKIDPDTLNLVEFTGSPFFELNVNIAYIFWNTSNSRGLIIGDERHGSKRDTTWHSVQHSNVGTVWRSGAGLTYTLNNDSTVTLGIGAPIVIQDEDLTHTITHSATPNGFYQQVLETAASLEVLYLNGSAYTSTTASTSPWIAGTSLARYNYNNGTSWSLADAPEGSYISYWLLATNDIRSPVKLVLGRTAHTSIEAAYTEEFVEYGLSFAEQVFMYQVVVKTSSAYTGNSAKVQIAGVRKILAKSATSASATVSATNHNDLTGRSADDVHPISSITNLQSTLAAISPLTTKGDLYTRTGTANARLPVGGDNLYLAADSTTESGLAWKSISVPAVAYTADSLTLTNGVYVMGDVTDTQVFNDGNSYQITDGTGAGPAWIITFTFTNVLSFNRIVANVDYTLASGHTIYFQLYNNYTMAWDNVGSYSGSTGFSQYSLGVLEYAPYISSGTVQARLYHSNAGNAAHTTKLDYFALEQSTQGAQGPRGATGATGTTGAGVVIGGTTGQSLVKASNTDYDTTWADRVSSVGGTAPISSSGGTTPTISISQATTSTDGYLSSTDWNTFNGKQAALVSGTNIKTINGNTVLGSGDLTITSSAAPAGSNTQIQYNNSGVLGASANFTYDPALNRLHLTGTDPEIQLAGITTEPTAPSANNLLIYAKSVGGRMMPKWVGPSGFDVPFQSAIAFNKIAWWNPPGNATTVPGVLGMGALTAIGTATVRNVATTNAFTRSRRLGYNSAGTAGSAAGHFSPAANAQFTLGTGAVGVGGFYYVCRFGSADTLAQAIMFVGMSSSTATPVVTTSPAALTNSIGVGCATGDTTMSIYYGGSAAQTPIALGAGFPAKTNSTDLYELVLFAPSNSATTIHYRVTNISTGVQASGTLTAAVAGTQLPLNTTLLGHRAYRSNNATATAVLIDIVSVYIETDT